MDGQGEMWNEALGSWQTSLRAKELAGREREREGERESNRQAYLSNQRPAKHSTGNQSCNALI